jgi:peptidoglycan/xylan/chitin deacetylase (PgdA/CDA1 family)
MHRTLCFLFTVVVCTSAACALEPIPDKLVVLTFDDASKSHYTVARPLLLKYRFGATFFVTEGWDFATNKRDYMTWEEIAQLHKDGFEIGNHTLDHKTVTDQTLAELPAQLRGIEVRSQKVGIPKPISFAYPGNGISKAALNILKENGIRFARRGGSPEYPYRDGQGFAYEPGLDHPLLIPSAGDARPQWKLADFQRAVRQARYGKIAVLQFHGVPDTAHDWVSTKREQFEAFLDYLAREKYTVVALRDLARYVDADVVPTDPFGVIEDRRRLLAQGKDGSNARPPRKDDEARYWLENALVFHRFSPTETGAALGLSADEVVARANQLGIDRTVRPARKAGELLQVLPYPGGRHPRIGFRDGAIRPQRETKVSVFAPWANGGYAVADVPEAVWFTSEANRPELLYLAHTHIPTYWDRQKVELPSLEWSRHPNGSLSLARLLPNRVTLTATIQPAKDGVRMDFRVTNGSDRPLSGLRVQMCVMLAQLTGFEARTNANKVFASPFAACKDVSGRRWVITGWQNCGRAWGNPPCPCLHADPVIDDCPAGQSRGVRGWLSFYEGSDIHAELRRLGGVAFAKHEPSAR